MAASRAGKLILGLVFVWAYSLLAADCLAVVQAENGEKLPTFEQIPPGEKEPLEPTPESTQEAEEPCNEAICEMSVCGPPGRFWIRADWMMWWTSGTHLPPLVIAGPPGTPAADMDVVYGDQTALLGGRSVVRLTFGGWLDRCHRWGVEADWLTMSGMSNHFEQATTSTTEVDRPFYDLYKNQLAAEYADRVAVDTDDYLGSTGVWMRFNLCCCDNCGTPACGSCNNINSGCSGAECGLSCNPCAMFYCRTDLLVGYRYYILGDRLSIHENYTTGTPAPAAFFDITDTFRTRNEFQGSEFGLATELRRGRWGLNIIGKIAMGSTRQVAYINGLTKQTVNNVTTPYDNGIYATLSNINTYTKDQFTVIPQLNMELSCQLSPRLRGFVGYNLLYWSSVWRAGDQIDLFIDPQQFPPTPKPHLPLPTFPGYNSNFWALGVNAGLELRF